MIPLTDQDAEHLGLLVVFHYLVGALGVLFSMLPLALVVMGTLALTGRAQLTDASGAPPAAAEMWLVTLTATAGLVVGLTLSTCILLAARSLRRCERYAFCLAVAGASCVVFPAGTIMGVLTILVLQRPTVKATFTNEPVEGHA